MSRTEKGCACAGVGWGRVGAGRVAHLYFESVLRDAFIDTMGLLIFRLRMFILLFFRKAF